MTVALTIVFENQGSSLIDERLLQKFGFYRIELVKLEIFTDLGSSLYNKNVVPFDFTHWVCVVLKGSQLV